MTAKVSFIVFFAILFVALTLDVILCCTVPSVGIAMIAGQILAVGACAMYGYSRAKKRSEAKE